jgi:chemotaxis protein histidine kinase CheA
MTNAEILEQVSKLEKGLSNPNIPESAKATLKKKIEGLKSELKEAEAKVEKKEEKLEKEEKKVQDELESTIAKLEKGLNNPNIPQSAKETIKKKIAAAKEELSKQKAEIKEDKKDSEKEKKEIKKAVAKIEEVAKKARTTPIKGRAKKDTKAKPKAPKAKAPKVKVEEKKRAKKSTERKSKLKGIVSDLAALIEKNKELKAKYSGKGVDLKKDAGRSAKPFCYRFVGKHDYRVPTAAQIKAGKKRGTIDYEGRPNRSDKYPKQTVKLARGGDVQGRTTDKSADGQRFAKPTGYRWKDSAVKKGIITQAQLSKSPSKAMIAKYPRYVYTESRVDKSDRNPSRKYQSLAKGGDVQGKVSDKNADGQRFAKPTGVRWKDKAVKRGLASKADLAKTPSKKMQEKYPNLVYTEKRSDKSDKRPSRKYTSL